MLASLDGLAKDIGIQAIVISELEFGDVERKDICG